MYTAKWFQVLQLFVIPSRLKQPTIQSVSLSMLSKLWDLCRDFVDPWALYCLFLMLKELHWIWLGQFECASWSFTVHLGVHMYSSNLANGSSCFLFKLPQLLNCACRVHFNLLYFFNCFLVLWGGGWFSFSFVLEVDLYILFVASFIFLSSGCWGWCLVC